MSDQEVPRALVLTAPTLEPLTVNEAKKHCYLATSDTSHDETILTLIQAAREQWEHDTDSAVLTQTLQLTAEGFFGREIRLPKRPIASVASVTYYDSDNTSQTLSTSIYSLNRQKRTIELVWNQTWPTTAIRWDAVTVTYVAGVTARNLVPAIAKQAMLLLVGYYFEQRGDNDRVNDMRAYEALVRRYMRSSYP